MPQSALIRSYYRSFDGLRALAFLLVFANHVAGGSTSGFFTSRMSPFAWGWIGVDFFFVLSGFLITGILLESLENSSFFRDFYIRRSLRIFPLYFLFWILLAAATPLLHIQWNRYLFSTVIYLGNLFEPARLCIGMPIPC